MSVREMDWQLLRQLPPEQAIPDALPGAWWVAHTKPRCEKVLATELAVRDVPLYLPLRLKATRSRRTGRRSWSIVPVFTGYLFFNGTEEQRVRALTTNRIVTVLPVADQAGLVQQLRDVQTMLAHGSGVECGPTVNIGDWVRVIAGPLAGLTGRILRKLSGLRLAINVHILAQSVSVEIGSESVERLDGPPDPPEPPAVSRDT